MENPHDQYYPPRTPQGNQFQPRPFGNLSQSQNPPWRFQEAQGSSLANVYQGDTNFRPMGQPRMNVYPQAQASEQDDMKSMMKQIMEGQTRAQAELTERFERFERKFDSAHAESQAKFADIYSRLETLDNQIAQVASISQRPAESLPGKPETNHKAYCNAITLRSGKEIASRGNEQGKAEEVVDVDDDTVQLEEIQIEESTEVKEPQQPAAEKRVEETETAKSNLPPPYEPKLPFPGRFKKQIIAKQKEKFLALMDGVQITMPLMEVIENNPTYSKFLKDMVTNKKKVEEGMVMVSYECSAIIKKSLPQKLADPGSFTLPCALGTLRFPKSMCDLGSSVNLMPLTVAKKIGITKFQKCSISLVLADRSVRIPVGIIENLPLRVGDYDVPTDFVVLEMDEEPPDPLILGRPFLATAGALIDVKKGEINLQLGHEVLKFDINKEMTKPPTEGQVSCTEGLDALADKTLEEISVENPLQKAFTVKKREYGSMDADNKGDEKLLYMTQGCYRREDGCISPFSSTSLRGRQRRA